MIHGEPGDGADIRIGSFFKIKHPNTHLLIFRQLFNTMMELVRDIFRYIEIK